MLVHSTSSSAVGGRPAPLRTVFDPTTPDGGSNQIPLGTGCVSDAASDCVDAGAGSTAGPSVMMNGMRNMGRSGSGDCCMLRYGKVKSPCRTVMTCVPIEPVAGMTAFAYPFVVTDEIQPLKLLSYETSQLFSSWRQPMPFASIVIGVPTGPLFGLIET